MRNKEINYSQGFEMGIDKTNPNFSHFTKSDWKGIKHTIDAILSIHIQEEADLDDLMFCDHEDRMIWGFDVTGSNKRRLNSKIREANRLMRLIRNLIPCFSWREQ